MLFRNSSIYLLAKIIPGLIAFTALSLYTHLLSPEEYGIYTLITSATVLLHNVIYNWLAAGTLRFWANEKYNNVSFTSTLTTSYIKISLALLIFTILLFITSFWDEKLERGWIISSYLLLLSQAIYTITQSILNKHST